MGRPAPPRGPGRGTGGPASALRPGRGHPKGFGLRRLFAEEARLEDGSALAELERSGAGAWNRGAFEREIRSALSRVWVLRSPDSSGDPDRGIVAYCAFRIVADEMEVLGLAVAPASRRQGLGRWLLQLALSRGRREGVGTAFLEVRPSNAPAIRLYLAAGFRERGRRPGYYDDPAEDALVLACALSSGNPSALGVNS